MKRFIVLVGLPAFIIFGSAAAGLLVLQSFNQFDGVERSFGGRCTPVFGIAGPEDLQIDHRRSLAYISSFDRRASGDGRRGAIYAFALDDVLNEDAWRDRTGGALPAFEPVGLSYYEDETVRRLFVVNAAAPSVELFDIADNGDLEHIETFAERRLTSPNDVVAVGPRAFYVTNDIGTGRKGALAAFLFLTRAGAGQVLYHDGVVWRIAAQDLRFANGVNVSHDGARLYVAETAGGSLRIFDRDPETGLLEPRQTVAMDAALDNIDIDETGALWIAAHPKPLVLWRLLKDQEARAPSLILRYEDDQAQAAGPETIYADDGGELSAATVAARQGKTMLVGALYEDKFLICRLAD